MSKFPHYKQLDAMDCGPTYLRMVAKYYGKSYSLQYLRNHSFITREGVSMLGISDAAESISFRTKGYRLTWERLRDEVPLPCIVHWNQRHFVVVYGIKKKKRFSSLSPYSRERKGTAKQEEAIFVADPAIGLLTYTKKDFLKCWISTRKDGEQEGTTLLLEPTAHPAVFDLVRGR